MLPLDAGRFDPASPGGHPANWVATGRSGGVSGGPFASLNLADHVGDDAASVAENRARCARQAGVGPGRVAVMAAVHGAEVAVVDRGCTVPDVDALVTTESGLVLLALAADCVPIALAAPDEGIVAVAHCGWRGLVAGVVDATCSAMERLGARRIEAVVGPSVCGGCYRVDAGRLAEVRSRTRQTVAAAAIGDGRLDLAAGVMVQLGEAGVDRVRVVAGCTVESPRLFSYRRDGITGRQGMMAWR